MTDTELLDFCDKAFARDAPRRKGISTDVAIGDMSVALGRFSGQTTFRDIIEAAVKQRINAVTKRLTN